MEGLLRDANKTSLGYAGSHSNPRSVTRVSRPVASHGACSSGQIWDFICASASERCSTQHYNKLAHFLSTFSRKVYLRHNAYFLICTWERHCT
ncbi:hypothetical protein Syun_019229 [Stephania yunnanensis]|uniref:Uncharacterized protein n=1 Tax=Stephania yunnanensis TaxID=152371 RepID=A0AAP0NVQ7_9MAGN